MINSFCFQTKGKPATGENIKAYRSNTEDTETQNGFINSSTKKNNVTWSRVGRQVVSWDLYSYSAGLKAMK